MSVTTARTTMIENGSDEVALGWTGRVMQWLRVVTALVAVNVMFLLGALAGLVLLGVMPAAVAAAAVLRRNEVILGAAEEGLVRTFWTTYRSEFWRANRAGIPFWTVGILFAADLAVLPQLAGPVSAVLLVFTGALLIAAVTTFAVAITLLSRYDDGAIAVLRYALVLPPTSLVMSIGVLVAVVAWALIVSILPVLLPLAGIAVPLVIAVRLIDARLDRIEDAD
ncbi:YesL family protein [Microbacterium sp. NPDC056234]|uniref:YesL family protein n=1 Tax=Microbacterium sp. NPDC056234 TaxID=3345757 RepID=UPI0035E3678A